MTDSVKNKDFAYGPAVQSVLDALAALQEQLDYRNKVLTRAINQREAAEAELAALKTKLANPVVLPAGFAVRAGHPINESERNVMIPKDGGNWLSRFDVEHAIHFSGFTVKGE